MSDIFGRIQSHLATKWMSTLDHRESTELLRELATQMQEEFDMSRLTSLPMIRRARDEATRHVILDHLRTHGSVPAAADALGCARETLQRWCGILGIDTWEATGRDRPATKNVTLSSKG